MDVDTEAAEKSDASKEAPIAVILLVEDEERVNVLNKHQLEKKGYEVYAAKNLAEAREHLAAITPDIILLDVDLPDGSGFDFCEEIRRDKRIDSNIIFVTGKTKYDENMHGLEIGGDIYIKKPYRMTELLVNIGVVIRQREKARAKVKIIKGGLTIDREKHRAYENGVNLQLSITEFDLLFLLAGNEDTVLDAEYIYQTVWETPLLGNKNALAKSVERLRKKLETSGYTIDAKRNVGYVFTKS